MTTTATAAAKPTTAKKATTAKAPAPKPDHREGPGQAGGNQAGGGGGPRAEAVRRPRADRPDPGGRAKGFTCRKLAELAGAERDEARGSEWRRLATVCDGVSHGGSVLAANAAWLIPVLDRIESGDVTPPERAVRQPSGRAAALHALEAATAEKTATAKQKLIDEALGLLRA